MSLLLVVVCVLDTCAKGGWGGGDLWQSLVPITNAFNEQIHKRETWKNSADLQKQARAAGIKANMKKDDLIAALRCVRRVFSWAFGMF